MTDEPLQGDELIGQRAWHDRRNWLRRFVSMHYKMVVAVVLASVTGSVLTVISLGIRAPALMATMTKRQDALAERIDTLEDDRLLDRQINRGVGRWLCKQDRSNAGLAGVPCAYLESELGRR